MSQQLLTFGDDLENLSHVDPISFLSSTPHLIHHDLEMPTFLKAPEPESSGLFVPTLNQMGYMTTHLDPYSLAFVDYASKTQAPVLEIGAAYGVATLAALAKGARIICNDLSAEHLLCVQKAALFQQLDISKLYLMPGDIRSNITLPSDFLSAILICRVLHFFSGPQIESFLAKAYQWLKPGSKIFIIAETPYLGFLSSFISNYEKNVKLGLKWPGYIRNLKDYIADLHLPKMINSMDVFILKRVLLEQGFVIEKINFIDRSDFPEARRLDGRESVGVIAYKPIISTDSRCP